MKKFWSWVFAFILGTAILGALVGVTYVVALFVNWVNGLPGYGQVIVCIFMVILGFAIPIKIMGLSDGLADEIIQRVRKE